MTSELNSIQISSSSGGASFAAESSTGGANKFNASVTDGATATINGDMTGNGTIIVGNRADNYSSTLTLNGVVGSDETVQIVAGTLVIDQPPSFAGSIDWNYDTGTIPAQAILAGTKADSFSFNGSEMSFFQAGQKVLDVNIHQDQSGLTTPWNVSQTSQGVVISSLDPSQIVGAMPLTHLQQT